MQTDSAWAERSIHSSRILWRSHGEKRTFKALELSETDEKCNRNPQCKAYSVFVLHAFALQHSFGLDSKCIMHWSADRRRGGWSGVAAAYSYVLDGGDEGPDVSLVSCLFGSCECNRGVQDGRSHTRVGIILAFFNWRTIKFLTQVTDNLGGTTKPRRLALVCENMVVKDCAFVLARTNRAT